MKTLPYSSQRGLTLIELMIAMLLGMLITAGVIQIFISAKQAYRLQENISRLQENGRFAMNYLSKDVRMAGFVGCVSKVTPTNIATPKNPNPNPYVVPAINSAIEGMNNVTSNNWSFDSVNNPTFPCSNECIKDTDVISFQSAGSCNAPVSGNTAPDNANLKIPSTNTCDIQKFDVLIVSDCTNADIFVTNNTVNDSGNSALVNVTQANAQNSQPKLAHSFGNDAEIYKPQLISYFIRYGASGVPALWRADNARGGVAELIEGIENMQILYGVDTELNTTDCPAVPPATDKAGCYVPNYYVDASQVPNWQQVVSVRINLLAVSIENNLVDLDQTTNQPPVYFFNGSSITPSDIFARSTDTSQVCQPTSAGSAPTGCIKVKDLRLRRAFSSTITIRNRLP